MKCSWRLLVPSGLPRSADHERGGSQSACQHPELVQEGPEAVPQPRARRSALPLPGCVLASLCVSSTSRKLGLDLKKSIFYSALVLFFYLIFRQM